MAGELEGGFRSPAQPGWYDDTYSEGQEQYWDGERWTDARRPKAAAVPTFDSVSNDQRRALLARQLSSMVTSGWRIESQSDYQAVTVAGKPVNHVLHLILSIVTVGLWLFIWLILSLAGGERRQLVTVDEFGNLAVQKV